MLDFDFSIKNAFLDRQKIQRKVDREERRAMNRSLGWIRTTARRSLRVAKKKSSEPGNPPKVRYSKSPLKMILYAYDQRTGTGVVGPIKLDRRSNVMNPVSVPNTLEHGATVTIRARRSKSRKSQRNRRARVVARPFMQPALDKAVENGVLLDAWMGVVSE